jgi:hypothetical protein
MIVTTIDDIARTVAGGDQTQASRSLARRGFFFSETESIDYVWLAPQSRIGSRGRAGTEEIWFVLGGTGELVGPDGRRSRLTACDLAVCALDSGTDIQAGPDGIDLILIAVHPRDLCAAMPTRLPVAS